MAYRTVIVIFSAFAKKNDNKIRFENRKEISTVVPLLSFYTKENEKNHTIIHFIIKRIRNDVMHEQKNR